MTEDKGGVVFTKLDIAKGTYILKYVGEVVTKREFKDRMGTIYRTNILHYCLHLDGGLVINGHRMGNNACFAILIVEYKNGLRMVYPAWLYLPKGILMLVKNLLMIIILQISTQLKINGAVAKRLCVVEILMVNRNVLNLYLLNKKISD